MWYFAWLLGFPLAAAFAVLNAMWYELMDDEVKKRKARAADEALVGAPNMQGLSPRTPFDTSI